jgi:hypothetical protein
MGRIRRHRLAILLVLLGALILFSATLATQSGLRVVLFGAIMVSVGASWLCDARFATRLVTQDPDLWQELGRPEVNQPWGPERYRKLYFRFLPAARYPRGFVGVSSMVPSTARPVDRSEHRSGGCLSGMALNQIGGL